MNASVLFYVQHLLGVGHLRRAEILCRAMAESGCSVTVALGGVPVPEFSFPGARIVQLPAAKIENADFSRLLDEAGRLVSCDWQAIRRDMLLRLFEVIHPDVLLLEMYPFGRRQFRFELDPILKMARSRSPRPAIVASVRDILVSSDDPRRADETIETLRRLFDAVLVHADPEIVQLDATFSGAARIADLVHYTGFVCEPGGEYGKAGQGDVVVSAGGGAVGVPLLFAAARAQPLTPFAKATWRLITGPNFPDDDFRTLAQLGGSHTVVERYRPDFRALLAGCALSISQAGYNTITDIVRLGARAVVIPFESDGETEQRRRAELFAERGLLTVLSSQRLSAETLASAVTAALTQVPSAAPSIDFSGAARTASLVAELARSARLASLPE